MHSKTFGGGVFVLRKMFSLKEVVLQINGREEKEARKASIRPSFFHIHPALSEKGLSPQQKYHYHHLHFTF
jgi:hypothetical protein